MSIDSIPLMYFKPTIFLVDDNRTFLENLCLELSYPGHIETFTNPNEALEALNLRKSLINRKVFTDIIHDDAADEDRVCYAVSYDGIMNIAKDAKRFNEVAVVVADYSMPEMNGISFCQNIKHLNCLKIMLTAEADHSIAVEAFNAGVIQKFIIKDPKTLKSDILNSINDYIHRYFVNFSESIYGLDNEVHSNKSYISVVQEWINKQHIVEYYACGNNGSKFGLDSKGNSKWFISNSEKCIDDYIEIGKTLGATQNILDALQSKKFQLCLVTERQKKEPVSKWIHYLTEVSEFFEISGVKYYISFVENLVTDDEHVKKAEELLYDK